jgi:fibronectin-binding autotransporter adhesin
MSPSKRDSGFLTAAQPRGCDASQMSRRRRCVLTLVPLAAVLAGAWSQPAVAVTYTWSNGAAAGNENRNWGLADNWVGNTVPTFDNQADIVFNQASIVLNSQISFLGANRTIRSLSFGANLVGASNTYDVRTSTASGSGAADLIFSANSGNASITVDQSTSGVAQIRIGENLGRTVLNSNLDLAQNNTFLTANPGFQFNNSIAGAGAINKSGAGRVVLVRDNSSWSGGMNINEGEVLIFNHPNAMGTGTWTLGGGANNTSFSVGSTQTYSNAGGLVVASGAGTRTIANSAANAGNPTLSGNITLNKDATFAITNVAGGTHDRMTLSGAVGGTGGIVKTNTGILIVSGSGNNYSGTTDIQGGKFYLAGNGRLGTGDVTIASGANLDFATGASQTNVVANNISGDGQIFQNVASTDTRFTGNVTNTGGLTINTGIVRIGNGGTTGSYTGNATVASGATLAFARDNAYTHGGTITGAGNVTKTSQGTVTLTGNNSYTGDTTLFTGVLVADNANAFGSTGNIVFRPEGGNNGTIRYTAASAGTDWASRIQNSTGTIRLDTAGQDVNLAGAIGSSNTNGFIKSGAGVLTLGGDNAYTGATTVSAGGLIINGTHSGLGLASVASGARIGGTGSLAGDLSILSGGLFVFNPLDPTLDVAGAVTLADSFSVASLVNLDGTAISWGSVADSTYSLIGLTSSTFNTITNFGSGDPFDIGDGRTAYFTNTTESGGLSLVVVPEPSTFALLGSVAAVGVFMMRRRRTIG